jgi:DNA-binding transcriptional MocR family regulator
MHDPTIPRLRDWNTGSGPLYRRLAGSLRGAIEAGSLPIGTSLPAERVLAKSLAVSRTTVVGAYDILRDEGWVESQRGSGTRVRRSPLPAIAAERAAVSTRAFQRNGVFRALVESNRAPYEFLGVHLPAARPFLDEAYREVAEELPALAVGPGYTAFGLPGLREAIAARFARRGLPTSSDQILVTAGAQQAISLAASLFLHPGEVAVTEDPTYLGAIDVFAAGGAQMIPVGVGIEGPDLHALEGALRRDAVRLLYLMPTHQNPTGATTPERARRQIARLVEERGIPLIEDETMLEMGGRGSEPPPPVAAFARRGAVLTVGSLSKLVWGGLRVGWIRADEALVARLARMRALSDLGGSILSQAVAARLVPRTEEIARERRKQIAERMRAATSELASRLPEWSWRPPAGGLSLWVKLPRGDSAEFAREAERHGVAILPGSMCSPRSAFADHIRMPCVMEPARIREGVASLARAWKAWAPPPRRAVAFDVVV